MVADRTQKYPRGTYRLTIVSTAEGDEGFFAVNLVTRDQLHFPTLWAMIQGIDRNLDQCKFPQYTVRLRKWGSRSAAKAQLWSSPSALGPEGRGQTFLLKVLHRDNATWQGTLQRLDGGKPREYASEIELLRLLNG